MCSPSQYTFISILSYIIYKEREKERERERERELMKKKEETGAATFDT